MLHSNTGRLPRRPTTPEGVTLPGTRWAAPIVVFPISSQLRPTSPVGHFKASGLAQVASTLVPANRLHTFPHSATGAASSSRRRSTLLRGDRSRKSSLTAIGSTALHTRLGLPSIAARQSGHPVCPTSRETDATLVDTSPRAQRPAGKRFHPRGGQIARRLEAGTPRQPYRWSIRSEIHLNAAGPKDRRQPFASSLRGPDRALSRASCSLSSGVRFGPKSSSSKTGRISNSDVPRPDWGCAWPIRSLRRSTSLATARSRRSALRSDGTALSGPSACPRTRAGREPMGGRAEPFAGEHHAGIYQRLH